MGSPPRDQSSPRQGPWPRRVDPPNKTRGRQVRRDKRDREGPPEGREAVVAEHSSDGSNAFHSTHACERLRAAPAGRDMRAGGSEAGKPGNHCRPWDLVQRRRRRASSPNQGGAGARDSEPEAHPAATGTDRPAGLVPEGGRRRMTRVVGVVGPSCRMETCGTEEPDEGNLHVRICGEGAGEPVPLPGR